MDIEELGRRIMERSKTMTRAERIKLLRDAHIIDEEGYYKEGFFSEETIARDRANGKPTVL
ncbi:hypothetical protein [Acerihabitans arboris]|uniref:Uncharacterized protein n=1 Tax=Acerihabitans arboris TaxID=2691583 RepID=A0A845SL69_9GAMM|nr:hypothetical protein [Acerihabitans arboris]NDL63736.1 hypothetical protein [Acerihabitans arboris]